MNHLSSFLDRNITVCCLYCLWIAAPDDWIQSEYLWIVVHIGIYNLLKVFINSVWVKNKKGPTCLDFDNKNDDFWMQALLSCPLIYPVVGRLEEQCVDNFF